MTGVRGDHARARAARGVGGARRARGGLGFGIR